MLARELWINYKIHFLVYVAVNTFSLEEFYDFVPSKNFSYSLKSESTSALICSDQIQESMRLEIFLKFTKNIYTKSFLFTLCDS